MNPFTSILPTQHRAVVRRFEPRFYQSWVFCTQKNLHLKVKLLLSIQRAKIKLTIGRAWQHQQQCSATVSLIIAYQSNIKCQFQPLKSYNPLGYRVLECLTVRTTSYPIHFKNLITRKRVNASTKWKRKCVDYNKKQLWLNGCLLFVIKSCHNHLNCQSDHHQLSSNAPKWILLLCTKLKGKSQLFSWFNQIGTVLQNGLSIRSSKIMTLKVLLDIDRPKP